MKKILLSLFAFALLIASCQKSDEAISPTASLSDEIQGKYIVVYNDGANLKAAENATYEERIAIVGKMNKEIMSKLVLSEDKISQTYGYAIKGFAAELTDNQVDMLKKDSRIAYIEEDKIWSISDNVEGIYTLKAQTVPWGITRVGGPANYTGTAKVWVIDTGIDLDHPDLNVNTTLSKTFITKGTDSKTADDLNGHGSHVSGTIAAKNNTVGVVGVAPGATLVAVKVLNSKGSGTTSGVIAGIDYVGATATAGDVANMSLGGGVSTTIDNAVLNASNKGIWFCLAAGNESDNANNHSPARVNGNYIYTISAFDNTGKFASFSNYGNPPIDYSAPGVSIYSTYKNGGYATLSGTSMATPHATGIRLVGAPSTDGTVTGDKDSTPDFIMHL